MARSRTQAAFLMAVVLALTCMVLALSAAALADIKKTEPPTKILLKKTEPRSVATMRHKGSFEDVPAVIVKLVSQVYAEGYHMAGPVMAIYYSNPEEVPEEELLWEIWAPIAYLGPVRPVENDEMGFRYLDPMFVAYTYHIGPFDKIAEAYESLVAWAERNKYRITGPPIELFWSDPGTVPEEQLVTEIWFPVEEKRIPGVVK